MHILMIDNYGREVTSLRIAVTQRCNQECIYCHNEGQLPSQIEMTLEDIERTLEAVAATGAKKVKITGGEPLMRKDIVEIVEACSNHFGEVSLTTNAVLLRDLAMPLREAGLDRINISLDTLNGGTYERITGRDHLSKVLEGIDAATEAKYRSMKLNAVVLRGLNHHELEDMAAYSAEKGAILQLIELTSRKEDTRSSFYQTYHYDLEEFERVVGRWASGVLTNEIHNRKRYVLRVNGWKSVIEVVRPMSNREFCAHCSRIRVTSDGKIKPCLLTNSGEIEALDLMKVGENLEALKGLFRKAIMARKPYWD